MKHDPLKLEDSLTACVYAAWGGSLTAQIITWLLSATINSDSHFEFSFNSIILSIFLLGYFIFLVGLVVFISLIFIGLPVQAYLQKCGLTGVLWHVIPATLLAYAMNPVLNASYELREPSSLFLPITGFVSSLIVWLIRRPDKDGKPA